MDRRRGERLSENTFEGPPNDATAFDDSSGENAKSSRIVVVGSKCLIVFAWAFSGCSVLMVFVCMCRGVVSIRSVL